MCRQSEPKEDIITCRDGKKPSQPPSAPCTKASPYTFTPYQKIITP